MSARGSMSDLTFGLLVLGVPAVCIAVALLLGSAHAFFDRHPTLSWAFQFFLAGDFIASAFLGYFGNPPRKVSAVISGAFGVALAIRTFWLFRARETR